MNGTRNQLKTMSRQAAATLNTASRTAESLRIRMDQTAATLPEYPVVQVMYVAGPTLGQQLMAKIVDITRFTQRGTLTIFASVDPGAN